ncbi:MAG TPA: sigma-70 family RNA polymerase sigma factor [Daejeonella sp.]|uniref:RNA polymerase sigma factor n=1 Tax=Daejeonella sp. TaxID=2805397 RepID=UPI002ED91674
MESKDDHILIGRISDGDSSAYRFLVDRNKKIVYSIAFRILGNKEDAEDASQESFIKAYNQLHTFEGKSKFSTWIYTITYRTCVSRLQKKSIDINTIDQEIIEEYSDSTDNPHQELSKKEVRIIVKESINKLPKLDALIITLYYFNENSINEIEEITGLTASNIKIKLFRARKILEHELKFLN